MTKHFSPFPEDLVKDGDTIKARTRGRRTVEGVVEGLRIKASGAYSSFDLNNEPHCSFFLDHDTGGMNSRDIVELEILHPAVFTTSIEFTVTPIEGNPDAVCVISEGSSHSSSYPRALFDNGAAPSNAYALAAQRYFAAHPSRLEPKPGDILPAGALFKGWALLLFSDNSYGWRTDYVSLETEVVAVSDTEPDHRRTSIAGMVVGYLRNKQVPAPDSSVSSPPTSGEDN